MLGRTGIGTGVGMGVRRGTGVDIGQAKERVLGEVLGCVLDR